VGRCGLDASGRESGPMPGFCEHGNELSGPMKGGEFLDYFSDSYLLKNSSAPRN
jgi:hypothetical protein